MSGLMRGEDSKDQCNEGHGWARSTLTWQPLPSLWDDLYQMMVCVRGGWGWGEGRSFRDARLLPIPASPATDTEYTGENSASPCTLFESYGCVPPKATSLSHLSITIALTDTAFFSPSVSDCGLCHPKMVKFIPLRLISEILAISSTLFWIGSPFFFLRFKYDYF